MDDTFPTFVFPTWSETSGDGSGGLINVELDLEPGRIVFPADVAALIILEFLHETVKSLSLVYPTACKYNIKRAR